ncbi:hypothetical protein JKP88DRAFT_287206 [Tribonema minus]|uniref:Uncharacterized protein n=1 Tax=Tribonema minus TaxID=303371 RepID=A0A835Z6X8_9STRA|nr:hypothetical protein JKP88DRAFT_287206 [Tribonema minus]
MSVPGGARPKALKGIALARLRSALSAALHMAYSGLVMTHMAESRGGGHMEEDVGEDPEMPFGGGALDPTTHSLFSAAFDHFGAMSRDTQALLHALAEQSSQGSYNLTQRVAFWRRRTSLALQRALTRVVIDNWNAGIAPAGDVSAYRRIALLQVPRPSPASAEPPPPP